MGDTTVQVREALAGMVKQIIGLSPPLEILSLYESGFDEAQGGEICEALNTSNITSLTQIFISQNPSWIDN